MNLLNALMGRTSKPVLRKPRRMQLENLEDRQLMTINPGLVMTQANTAYEIAPIASEGSINFNANTGAVTVNGKDNYSDRVTISRDWKGTLSTADDTLKVYLTNIGTPLFGEFKYTSVKRVFVNTYGGADNIDNQSSMPMTAYGGRGIDVILGGSGGDSLLGGEEDDYLDGRGGGDYVYGEAGNDALFGDDGIDTLLGGIGFDRLFGGNDDDYLYGEGDNDILYGGAGTDKLTDPLGSNTLYTDYGPDYSISASGFTAFDWFDKNLQDASLRSLSRLEFRDGVLDRSDMLTIYTSVAADYSVVQNEINDLKDLVSTRVNMQTDTRFFSTQIAMGNVANAHYQGTTLGNLVAGTSDRLNKLVDKWFKGGDVPAAAAGTHYVSVAGSLFQDGVSYTDISQGETGDCYFLAALGEVAQHQPAIIRNMIAANSDGTWTVRFMRGNSAAYVTVNRMLPVSGFHPVYASLGEDDSVTGNWYNSPRNELWVALIEKAYAQLNESNWIGQDGTNSYAGIAGGQPSDALAHLAGASASNNSIYDNFLYTSGPADFIAAVNAGQAVTLSSDESPGNSSIVGQHSYMVIGYDANTQKVKLYNPWGQGNNNSDKPTELELSWSDIAANFYRWTAAWV